MGSSRWSDAFYSAREADRATTGTSAFVHDHAVKTGVVEAKVHERMDPKGVKFRESRDSEAHPESRALAVWFDVTGSMGGIPLVLQKKLAGLMAMLIKKGYIAHPQIMFGGIGDASTDPYRGYQTDKAPLQVGQFESGIEMDDDLGRLFLEGGGGGQSTESYELAMYFTARHTAIDCFEKRGEKGYAS